MRHHLYLPPEEDLLILKDRGYLVPHHSHDTCKRRVEMDDGPDVRASFIDGNVHHKFNGRSPFAFNHLPFEIGHNDVLWRKLVVIMPARGDGEKLFPSKA